MKHFKKVACYLLCPAQYLAFFIGQREYLFLVFSFSAASVMFLFFFVSLSGQFWGWGCFFERDHYVQGGTVRYVRLNTVSNVRAYIEKYEKW